MRRADRLFAIIQALRGGRLRRAEDLAAMMEVSARTIYRDLVDLQAQGVPIDGERGVGYLLRDGFFLPPLALTAAEWEALQWGVAFVCAHGDDTLAGAAKELQVKFQATSTTIAPITAAAYGVHKTKRQNEVLATIRNAIATRHKLLLDYTDAAQTRSKRTVRPLELEHWGTVWTVTAWCEHRSDFRVFRLDRLASCNGIDQTFKPEPEKRLEDYLRRLAAENPGAA